LIREGLMNRWMKIAYDEAVSGMLANEGGPFGAVIVKDGKVIAKAHNKVLASNDPTAHAEVNAIREASKVLGTYDLSETVLYTSCEPCPMCLGAIFWARIQTVYYGATKEDAQRGGFDDAKFYDMFSNDKEGIKFERLDGEESAKLFDLWNQKSDAQIY
jgi:guanine deaminase